MSFAEDNEMVQALRSHRSHPSLSDGIGSMQPERRATLPYPEAPQATIEACSIAAVAIMNQESWRRSIPGAAFHHLLCDPASCRMSRHFNVEDLSVSESNDEEDVKRLEQDRRDAEKVASPNVRCMPRQELSPRPGWPPAATLAYIWPRSWRKPETLTLPIRPGCAFDPKGDSRQPCVRSKPEALLGSPGDHLLFDEKIATSSTPSNRLAANPEPSPVSQSATDDANR